MPGLRRILTIWAAPLVIGALGGLMVLTTTTVKAETTGAKPAATGQNRCVDVSGRSNRRVVSKNQVLVEDGFGRSALLSLSAPCGNLDELDIIGFELNGSSYLCGPHDMKILRSHHGEPPLTCLIDNVKFMDREETKAFEAQEKIASSASK